MDRKVYGRARIKEVEAGMKSGVDTSIYDDIKYDGRQMYQLRKGLESGIDVSLYANEEFDNRQMEQIRLGLEAGISEELVKAYAKVDLNVAKMIQVRECIEQELLYTEDQYSPKAMNCIRRAIQKGYDVDSLINPTEMNDADMLQAYVYMDIHNADGTENSNISYKPVKKKGFFKRLFK